jgi:isopenicillin N synthase-like dioxygenase
MDVKVISLRSKDFDYDFMESIISTGFAVVKNFGVDLGLIRDTQAGWKEFFNKNRSYKDQFVNSKDSNLGFTGFGGEKAVGAQVADIKEFFHYKPGVQLPDEVSVLTQKLYSLLEGDVSGRLLHTLNRNESIPVDFVEVCRNSNNTLMRAIYYPSLDSIKQEPGAVRAAAHEDINILTLLVAASAPGLEVQDNVGRWHSVPFEENSLIVNAGDMLQLASGGRFKSTTHRVVNPDNSNSDRLSIPLFVHANGDTILVPGITAQQYLDERLNAIYQKGYK